MYDCMYIFMLEMVPIKSPSWSSFSKQNDPMSSIDWIRHGICQSQLEVAVKMFHFVRAGDGMLERATVLSKYILIELLPIIADR